MADSRIIVRKIDERGVLPLLELALNEEWTGAMRLQRKPLMGTLWIVKGQIAHAMLQGTASLEGPEAFEALAGWQEGECILESEVLPPERTIRVVTQRLLADLREHTRNQTAHFGDNNRTVIVGRTLVQVFDGLRERVPGLESLTLMRGPVCEATTSHDAAEMDWMDRQLKSFFAKDHQEPDTLFVQEGEHSLLILKQGGMATVLSAKTGTAPEALFWAGAEAQRRVSETAKTILAAR